MQKGMRKLVITTIILVIATIVVNILVFNFYDNLDKLNTKYYLKDYKTDITITQDGVARINESHFLKFRDRDDPWWNYYKIIDLNNFGTANLDMNSVSIKVDGVIYPMVQNELDLDDPYFDKIYYENMSYFTRRGNMVELGVIMPFFDDGEKVVEISYNLNDILLKALDVGVFYYQIVPANNNVPIKNLVSNIKFKRNSRETLRTWLHLKGSSSNVEIVSDEEIKITASNIPKKTFVETRTTLDAENYNSYGKNIAFTLNNIIDEEKSWKESSDRELKLQKLFVVLDVFIGVVVLIICLVVAIKDYIIKKRHQIDNVPTYLHEPPENLDMEEGMPIFHYYDMSESYWSDVISGTIMNLVRKKYLTIISSDKKKGAQITIINNGFDELKRYEQIVMEMLSKAGANNALTMKDFEKWCSVNYKEVEKLLKSYKNACKKRAHSDRLMLKNNTKPSNRGFVLSCVGLGLSAMTLFAFNPFYITNILVAISGITLYFLDQLRRNPLRKGGERLYLELEAFKNYMVDFSNFDKKDIPELFIWQEYMVWATGMGIADEVSKQLSIVYPEFNDYFNIDADVDDFVFWYLFAPRFRFNVNMIGTSMRSSINSINALKLADIAKNNLGGGSGFGGGGFSGGGGGFGGGGGMGAR